MHVIEDILILTALGLVVLLCLGNSLKQVEKILNYFAPDMRPMSFDKFCRSKFRSALKKSLGDIVYEKKELNS